MKCLQGSVVYYTLEINGEVICGAVDGKEAIVNGEVVDQFHAFMSNSYDLSYYDDLIAKKK